MTNPSPTDPDDLLDRATAALRDAVPPGPSARLNADTLAALRGAEARLVRPRLWQQVIVMHPFKLASAAAVLVVGVTLYLLSWSLFSSVSYAQAMGRIKAARTVQCTVRTTLPGGATAVTSRLLWLAPGRLRIEGPGDLVNVTDAAAGRTLSLNPANHTAFAFDVPRPDAAHPTTAPATPTPPQPFDLVQCLKALPGATAHPADGRHIGGVRTDGFVFEQGGTTGTVYADHKTGDLVEVDCHLAGNAGTVVIDDFRLDADLDPALFSLTPPPGYQVQQLQLHVDPDVVANVVFVLQDYTHHSGGRFPTGLTDWGDILSVHLGERGLPSYHPATQPTQLDPETMALVQHMGPIVPQLLTAKQGQQWDYRPAAAKPGDSGAIVFWYRTTADAQTARAVYGDLHVAELPADRLPPASPAPVPAGH